MSETKGFHFSGWIHKRIWELTAFRCARRRGAITRLQLPAPAPRDWGSEQRLPSPRFYIILPPRRQLDLYRSVCAGNLDRRAETGYA